MFSFEMNYIVTPIANQIFTVTDKDNIPFTLTKPCYYQNTYWGRVWLIAETSDFRYACVSNSEVFRYHHNFKNKEAREKVQKVQQAHLKSFSIAEIEEL
jgi:hypothetical protein